MSVKPEKMLYNFAIPKSLKVVDSSFKQAAV